ncbi:ArsR/SmtB family transcription factor [Ferdinandcohnia quinoae]|uniref:Helix-turn-helix domain-containing protein n=1 Tax=Fredinandcohnia quinoae TaxID=2918902 RepID=A0AAW5E930_9BACI|nr:transcriptional regulator [Fredinandcohnia sp. SECRCQ15]MCH1625608.1 helix-turn-helix domain-containing protein [Fredinandcohnia sp. SECRCQ15]
MSNKQNDKPLQISVEQSKLLGNALRIKIIGVLAEEPHTAKQVADILGNSPGSVHYHIQKLYEGGLIELVETKELGGIIEKYYKSKSKWFNTDSPTGVDNVLDEGFSSTYSQQLSLRIQLTEQQREEMSEDFKVFLEKWVKKTMIENKNIDAVEYAIGVKIVSTEEKSK